MINFPQTSLLTSASLLITLPIALLLCAVVYLSLSLLKNLQIVKKQNIPYVVQPLESFSRILFFNFEFVNKLNPINFKTRFSTNLNEIYNSDVVAVVTPFSIEYMIGSAFAAKQILADKREEFPKPPRRFGNLFGENIVQADGAVWRRHRKIGSVGFTERNNRFVVSQTTTFAKAMRNELISKIEGNNTGSRIDILPYTLKIALSVICSSSFGIPCNWDEKVVLKEGEMSFFTALEQITTNPALSFVLPRFILNNYPNEKCQIVSKAVSTYHKYVDEKIETTKKELKNSSNGELADDRKDLFYNLIKSSVNFEGEEGGLTLNDSELNGNIFLFLLAGHETSAHTMAFMLGLLALNQDVQQKLYEDVKRVMGDEKELTYEHVSNFKYTFAVMNEALRLYPIALALARYSKIENTLGEKGEIAITPNSNVTLNILAVQHSKKYWGEDAKKFNPERFLNDYNKDNFLAFSDGPRVCLGRRFAQLEIVTAISSLVKDFVITCDPFETESSLLKPDIVITLVPEKPVNLTFTPRI